MKITDYYGRAAAMDFYLMGRVNLIGAEIGVDCGSHAQAMLETLSIEKLYLIDLWENRYAEGFCNGRLARWMAKVKYVTGLSSVVANQFKQQLDFIYIDIKHDYATVANSLHDWWPMLKPGGILGYRNYTSCQKAIDEFVETNNIRFEIDKYHNEIVMFK